MYSHRKYVDYLIQRFVTKYKDSYYLTKRLGLEGDEANRFIVTNLLDLYLTQISPADLAEYKNLRQKGII